MRVRIDARGRLVVPRNLRQAVGIVAGELEVTVEGAGLRIEPPAADSLEERGGRLVIPSGGSIVDDALIQTLRDADQR